MGEIESGVPALPIALQGLMIAALLRLRGLVEVEIRLHNHLFGVAAEVEAEFLRDLLHGAVVEEYLRCNTTQILGAGDLEEAAQEQCADAPALEAVADEDRDLSFVEDGAAAAQAGYAHDLTFPRLWSGVFGDQRHLAVVVYKADARQALVGRALVEVHHVEVAHVDALFREGLVEANHERLVFGPDRPYRRGRSVAQLFVGDLLPSSQGRAERYGRRGLSGAPARPGAG